MENFRKAVFPEWRPANVAHPLPAGNREDELDPPVSRGFLAVDTLQITSLLCKIGFLFTVLTVAYGVVGDQVP